MARVLYRNYLKVMPLATTAAAFLAGSHYTVRNTLVGERAAPGKYAAQLAEQAIQAEVTTAPSVALHRCESCYACMAHPSGGVCVCVGGVRLTLELPEARCQLTLCSCASFFWA